MKKFKIYLLFLFLLFISSCIESSDNNEKNTTENFLLKYHNGKIFTMGQYKVSVIDDDTTKTETGNWQVFYPDGQLKESIIYDDSGSYISYMKYSEDSILTYSRETNNDIFTSSFYSDSGGLKKQSILIYSEVDPNVEIVKTFYSNGQIETQNTLIDGRLDGDYKIWDKKGVLKLFLKYDNGNIVYPFSYKIYYSADSGKSDDHGTFLSILKFLGYIIGGIICLVVLFIIIVSIITLFKKLFFKEKRTHSEIAAKKINRRWDKLSNEGYRISHNDRSLVYIIAWKIIKGEQLLEEEILLQKKYPIFLLNTINTKLKPKEPTRQGSIFKDSEILKPKVEDNKEPEDDFEIKDKSQKAGDDFHEWAKREQAAAEDRDEFLGGKTTRQGHYLNTLDNENEKIENPKTIREQNRELYKRIKELRAEQKILKQKEANKNNLPSEP
jgi:antitoxin component YwqK of YwqJK toxin-antitoxin module